MSQREGRDNKGGMAEYKFADLEADIEEISEDLEQKDIKGESSEDLKPATLASGHPVECGQRERRKTLIEGPAEPRGFLPLPHADIA